MARYRLEICKGDEVRFVSHLDFMKAFERALRRAEIPVAFSEGFNPHPKISFGSALPVGVTSSCELVDLELQEQVDEKKLLSQLEEVLPPGIRLNWVSVIDQGSPALMAELNRAHYTVRVRPDSEGSLSEEELQRILKEFMGRDAVVVEKRTKKGNKEVDIRPGVFAMSGHAEGEWIELQMDLQTGSAGNVRAEDVLTGLAQLGLPVEKQYAKVHRTRLFSA